MLAKYEVKMMIIIVEDRVNLKKLSEFQQKKISFRHINQIMILDLQISLLKMLVINYTFSIYDTITISQLPNQIN